MVSAAADIAGVKFQLVNHAWADIKSENFKKIHPMNKIPVIETSEGKLFETNAILRHVARLSANKALYGGDIFE
jgi:glutathione S-transferase